MRLKKMQLKKNNQTLQARIFAPGLHLVDVARPLDELLASGGDGRLALNARDGRNVYGCTPFPRPVMLDFGSSTASSISEQAYGRAQAAQAELWVGTVLNGAQNAFDDQVEAARHALRMHLGASNAEIVFSPSGTDAQLQTLVLVKAVLGTPLVTIIVGADQTGSGTVHTAQGHHFSDRTSRGAGVDKGAPIAGLSEQVRTFGIPFCDEAGHLRSDKEMDAAVYGAVATAAGRGERVMLQVMDASKLGWRGPSAACLDAITSAWPDQVCIVVDACQMRVGRPQLSDYLGRGYFVLVTGSKFFTGPAFSGALLVPQAQVEAIDQVATAPEGLHNYTSRYDWPRRWHRLRETLPCEPNYGQWLRWEATLEEMNGYFAIPMAFRDDLLEGFAARVPQLIDASPNLQLLTEHCGSPVPEFSDEMRHRTIFSFVPHESEQALSLERCTSLYRAMGRDISGLLPKDAPDSVRRIAARICHIGQPVALRHRPGAALRICASARMVRNCWARAATPPEALVRVLADVGAVLEKIDWLIANPQYCEIDAS
jgi:selenocysteine lyase/cysteine desulfurase